jgi:DNA-binding protein HU-beta
MNKNDLISAVADVGGLPEGDAVKAVEAVFESITGVCPG